MTVTASLLLALAMAWEPGASATTPTVMLPPPVATKQLLSDLKQPPHQPTPPELARPGGVYWGLYKTCVSATGEVTDVTTIKGAHHADSEVAVPPLDSRWVEAIKTWRYQPYLREGSAIPFCYLARVEVGERGSKPITLNQSQARLAVDVNKEPHRLQIPKELSRPGFKTSGRYEVCVSATGAVTSVTTVSPPEEPTNALWLETIKRWRYRPHLVQGTAVPFCYPLLLSFALAG